MNASDTSRMLEAALARCAELERVLEGLRENAGPLDASLGEHSAVVVGWKDWRDAMAALAGGGKEGA